MRREIIILTLLTLAFAAVSLASDRTEVRTATQKLKAIGASRDIAPLAVPLNQHRPRRPSTLDDPIGEVYEAGTTYYEYQHNGSSGRMISVDPMGWIHLVWTNGIDAAHNDRHVYYNVWDPSEETFLYADEGGIQIDASQRAGYVSQATAPDGRCYPAFHQETTTQHAHAAVAIDFLPQSGAFTTSEPAYLQDDRCGNMEDMEIIWPKIAMDVDSVLHMVSTENPCIPDDPSEPQRIYYSRGHPVFDEFDFGEDIDWDAVDDGEEFKEIDTVMVIGADICASRHSNRLAMAWIKSREPVTDPDSTSQINNDIVYMISEDGGYNWGPEINITNFEYPDLDCLSGDTAECCKDTFRVYADLSLLFDEYDQLHIGFTTQLYRAISASGGGVAYVFGYSQIWHWSDIYDEISPIRAINMDHFNANWTGLGDWQVQLQKPRLAIDPRTGYLYAAYQMVDTMSWSAAGIPIADAWVSVSTDCGRSWSEGTNVSDTPGGQDTPAGDCQHERDITVAEIVSYSDGEGYLHMEYIFDRDAGGAVGDNPTGQVTLNPVYYQRIPINQLPAEPRWDHTWPYIHVDGRQVPYGGDPDPQFSAPCPTLAVGDGDRYQVPNSFSLYQNYPNPFNPSTQIQFDLARSMHVSLEIFNIVGQNVATLIDNERLDAGVQIVNFDAANLSSGVYVYTLRAEGLSQSRKMVLLK